MDEVAEDGEAFVNEVKAHTTTDNFDSATVESTSAVTLTRQPSSVPSPAPSAEPTKPPVKKAAAALIAG